MCELDEAAPKPSPFAMAQSMEDSNQQALRTVTGNHTAVVQQQQQQHDLDIEQVEDSLPQEPPVPQLEVRDRDPAEEPGTPELVAGSFIEGPSELLQPTAEDCSNSSTGRCNRGLQAGRSVVRAAAAVINFMQPRRRAKS